jgi:hypothetical protein
VNEIPQVTFWGVHKVYLLADRTSLKDSSLSRTHFSFLTPRGSHQGILLILKVLFPVQTYGWVEDLRGLISVTMIS